MALLSLLNVSIGFRGPNLLEDVTCHIEAGGRIGLLGRNGAGKTTLLKLLCGELEPDHGSITRASNAEIAYLPQNVPDGAGQTVREVTAAGLSDRYRSADAEWESDQRVRQTLSQMQLDGTAKFETLSSGMKRRVLLGRAIVSRPDVLLLDEPTNHLDIEAIDWLEGFLKSWRGTLLFVTHDRMFLRKVATRILEIDRGRLFDWSFPYEEFLRRKEAALAAEEKQNALFDKKLAQEEAWIRQGIKARRTRNEGRVRALKKMREERRQRRAEPGAVRLQLETGQRSGNLVAEVKDVSFAYGEQAILDNFSTTIMRGDKVGVIGPNGAGKTTLLKILLGSLAPDRGCVRTGANLQVAYFDQLRAQLDEEETIEENVGGGNAQLSIGGKQKHIIGYLQDFLFTPDRARTQVKFLSGGERHRVLLARLFAKPANVIVLDEPTNDLDLETLEMLEARLVEYEGTILLVSHDREFLNNVVTSTIAFEPSGVREYVGGYDDWLRQRTVPHDSSAITTPKPVQERQSTQQTAAAPAKKKLSFNEQRELDGLPAAIEQLEAAIAARHEAMADPSFYQQPGDRISAMQSELSDWEAKLAANYARWDELESWLAG